MKTSYYDVLQVSTKAQPAVIDAAYQKLKPALAEEASTGNLEAKNQLIFLQEAYATLSSLEKRKAYDESFQSPASEVYGRFQPEHYSHSSDNTFLTWWGDSGTAKLLLTITIFAAIFSVYKFVGQRGDQRILENKEVGSAQNDAYRGQNERMLVQGVVQNQNKAIDRSYDIATQEAERRRLELEYRANTGAQQLEMQRQRQEAQLQDQRWRQEQYEKERQLREAKAVADAPKLQLCNMYALNGKVQEARLAGCYNR